MKTAKKLFAALLAAMMVMALMTVPALAAGDGSITITTLDTATDHKFKGYQIFKGTLSSEGTLTNVEWGSGVDTTKEVGNKKLIEAIKAISLTDNSTPFAKIQYDTAASVSDVLSGNAKDSEIALKFQECVKEYLSSTPTTTLTYDTTNKKYSATNLDAGYYLIIDESTTNASDMMLEVVGSVNVTAKQELPSVTKYAGDEAVTDNAKFSVGDKIPYTIIGTVPNLKTVYTYEIIDTMDTTLDLDYTASVSDPAEVLGGVKVTINSTTGTDITDKFYITYSTNADHVLTIQSKTGVDLSTVTGLTADSKIYVTYNAIANSSVTTGTGITNKVVVKSTADGTPTETTEYKEQVYPITITITKVDGADDTKKLANAKFNLYRELTVGNKEYATTNTDGEFTGWTDDATKADVLVTDADGEITLVGIGAGTFYLTELEAPAGYNKLNADVKIDITSTSKRDTSGTVELESLKYSIDGGAAQDGDITNGTVSFNVENNQGAQLPSTGGIGTTIFYVVGGVLIVGAVVLLVTRKRMKED